MMHWQISKLQTIKTLTAYSGTQKTREMRSCAGNENFI